MALGAWLICTFVVTLALWFSTTTAINIAPGEVPLRQTLIFGQMIAVTIANLALSRSDGLPDDWGFAGLALAVGSVGGAIILVGIRGCAAWGSSSPSTSPSESGSS